jgi:hypothetical protein
MIVEGFNANDLVPSSRVGLHPQLVEYQVTKHDGLAVGNNQTQTIEPYTGPTEDGEQEYFKEYIWYAGEVNAKQEKGGVTFTPRPIEFGAINLTSSDRIKHSNKGAIGALIIEPKGATWQTDDKLTSCGEPEQPRCSRAAATVSPPQGVEQGDSDYFDEFREFVLLFQDDLNLRFGSEALSLRGEHLESFSAGQAVPNLADGEDPEDSGQKALNYRTEPMWFRAGWAPNASLEFTKDQVITDILSNDFLSDDVVDKDPQTPLFWAKPGTPVRFRVLEPGGHQRSHVFTVHGHVWQQEPYVDDSSKIGENKNAKGKWMTMFEGARMGHGPMNHFDAVLQNGAGGKGKIEGDYLYRDFASFLFDGGLWGIMRVGDYNSVIDAPTGEKGKGNGGPKPCKPRKNKTCD